MRCLYCGKELALLKRWTGGGEFCSDAHRQQYQEEYNQLALNRLLQAKPPGDGISPGEGRGQEHKRVEPLARPAQPQIQSPAQIPAPVPAPIKAQPQPQANATAPKALEARRPVPKYEEPVRAAAPEPMAEPVVEIEDEEAAPMESTGFLIELPVPVMAAVADSKFDLEMAWQFTPVLPARNGEGRETKLVPAGQVELEPTGQVRDYPARQGDRRLEVREFVRSAPKVEFHLRTAGEPGITEISEESMDILIFPHPPQGSPPLWQEAEQHFSFDTELGAFARVALGTTGIEDNLESTVQAKPENGLPAPDAVQETKPVVEPRPVVSARPFQPIEKMEPLPKPAAVVEPPAAPKPAPILSRPSFVAPATARPAEKLPAEKPVTSEKPIAVRVETTPERKPELTPAPITKPLPLTLHGLSAGRGKPVQVFASAVTAGVDVQIPRSSALPLRPVMIVGPAQVEEKKAEVGKPEEKKPAERTVVVKTDPKRPQPTSPDPRFTAGKTRKPEVRILEPEKTVEKVSVAATVKEAAEKIVQQKPVPEIKRVDPKPAETKAAETKPAAATPKAPAAKEPEKSAPVKEPAKPAPYAAPDLGLPSLSLENGNFFSKLPFAAKAGAALVIVAAIVGIAMMGGKGRSAAGAGEPQVVEIGTPLPAVESGWITDWGAEPGVRKLHEISVLRPSVSLSDYRIEFQAQIETKALGWVYRAKDGKNYYVNRLEVVKPGLNPTIALVRFAVIDGEEQPRSQFPLSIPVHVDTLYKIRFDAVGDRFTTYVQGQKVDEWTDSRIRTGGVGLYNERGERMSLKGGLNVVPLAIRK